MIKSMTAFGRSSSLNDGKEISIQIKSINSRFFDCTIHIPKAYSFLEERIKAFVQKNVIGRGKIDITVNISDRYGSGGEMVLDSSYAKSYLQALYQLRDDFNLRDDISVMQVARNPDLFIQHRPEEDMENDWEKILPTLQQAADSHRLMREQEGNAIAQDLLNKKQELVLLRDRIASLASCATERYQKRLETRLAQTLEAHGLSGQYDDARILTECAIFADKTAIDEELVRLSSHFDALTRMVQGAEPAGKKIDFLLQEINREVNTIGSKVSDLEITELVVEMKCGIEKIREQIQNIE